jgi:mRNA-degrading endonuclease toxin of MazEF toxin-antitoxin module
MTPRHGEVLPVDMGMAAKTRPTVVFIADNLDAPRSLVIHIPITRQNRGSELEVPLGHLSFLDPESVANVQAIGSLLSVRFEKRLGVLPVADLQAVKAALAKACAL